MLLKPSRKERSRHRGVQRLRDRTGTETEAQEEKCSLIDFNQWDGSRSPKMLSVLLVSDLVIIQYYC